MQMKNPEKYRVLTISVEVVVDALLITSIKQVLSLVEFQFQTENKIKMTNWLWVGSRKVKVRNYKASDVLACITSGPLLNKTYNPSSDALVPSQNCAY